VKDLFAALYRLNEEYHGSKERATWVAATLYFGFAVGAIAWLIDGPDRWRSHAGLVLAALVALCAVTTASSRNSGRSDSRNSGLSDKEGRE